VAALVGAAVLVPLGLVAGPVGAAAAASAPSVGFAGHGWGHGRGLGQWGAYGYAVDRGWDHRQILDHFYGGTSEGRIANDEVSVRLTALDGAGLVVLTSRQDFVVEGTTVPGGSGAVFRRDGAGWSFTTRTNGCFGADAPGARSVGAAPAVWLPASPGDDRSRMFTVCNTDRPYRGNFRPVVDATGTSRLVNHVPIESYLRGVVPRESSASWGEAGGGRGMAALRAQAVAARSYGRSERRTAYAQSCDTDSCQVYGGALGEDPRTDRAVAETAGQVRVGSGGAVARTEFSASTGGWTAGGTFPAVQDLGDTRAPRHDWTLTVPTSKVTAAWPTIGEYRSMTVLARNGLGRDGGRVTRARVTGEAGSVVVSGDEVRRALGLWSAWFTPLQPAETQWMLRTTTSGGEPETVVRYGGPTDTTLACDFDGDGRDGLTVYRAGRWDARVGLGPGRPDASFSYGGSRMSPVCGDWDGDGRDGIGVYEPATGRWFLRATASPGGADAVVQYGWSAATPVVGDWDGDGRDTLGVYAGGQWLLRNANTPGAPDVSTQYGWSGALPVPGDWDGDGRTSLGVYDRGRWLLRDSTGPGAPDRVLDYGADGYVPMPGRWGGSAAEGVGVTLPVL
jgi:SpoIID/LytB domain protein